MRLAPTRRAVVMAAIGGFLVLAGATAQAGWLFVLAAGILGLVAASLVSRRGLGSLEVTRGGPSRARVGDRVPTVLHIVNRSRRSAPMFVVEDLFPAFEPVTVASERLQGGTETQVEMARHAHRRGVYDEGASILSSAAPLGLVRSRVARPMPTSLTVVPRWIELSSFPILEPSSSPSELLHERARIDAGQEFLGVRDFRAGDPLRSVHWRSSARAGRLVVREYEQEVATRVGIVLAGDDHGEAPDSSFEALVSAVASIGLYAMSTGHPIHVVRHGGASAAPVHMADPGRHDLLDWLAAAQAGDGPVDVLVEELIGRVGRRGTVVICASSSGRAGASISAAVRRVQAAGARAIVVAARASSWDPVMRDVEMGATALDGGRAPVRVLEKDKEIAKCLAG